MGQLVDELKNQNQGPLPNDNEKLICIGKEEGDVEKIEIFEAKSEHMSKPSLLHNNEKVFQDAKTFDVIVFAHVGQTPFNHCVSTVVTHWTVGINYVIRSSGDFTKSCFFGFELGLNIKLM